MVNDTESTEIVAERDEAPVSIRERLQQEFTEETEASEDYDDSAETDEEPTEESNTVQTEVPEKPVFAPPADMNAAEKAAFLSQPLCIVMSFKITLIVELMRHALSTIGGCRKLLN